MLSILIMFQSENKSKSRLSHILSLWTQVYAFQNQDVEQQLLDNPAATGSNFMLDDEETTFVSGTMLPGGFCESTRNLDR